MAVGDGPFLDESSGIEGVLEARHVALEDSALHGSQCGVVLVARNLDAHERAVGVEVSVAALAEAGGDAAGAALVVLRLDAFAVQDSVGAVFDVGAADQFGVFAGDQVDEMVGALRGEPVALSRAKQSAVGVDGIVARGGP